MAGKTTSGPAKWYQLAKKATERAMSKVTWSDKAVDATRSYSRGSMGGGMAPPLKKKK